MQRNFFSVILVLEFGVAFSEVRKQPRELIKLFEFNSFAAKIRFLKSVCINTS